MPETRTYESRTWDSIRKALPDYEGVLSEEIYRNTEQDHIGWGDLISIELQDDQIEEIERIIEEEGINTFGHHEK